MKKLIKDPDPELTDAELRALTNDANTDDADLDEGEANAPLASTPVDLAHMGLDQVAYVRQAVVDSVPIWSIYSATGQQLGVAPTLAQAWGAIMQNDLQPLYVN